VTASSAPFVSIVVPVLNGERTIGDCLASLMRTEYPEDRREIIVVDNGSGDRTAEAVARYPVRALSESRPGPSHARNKGITEAVGELVAFTDADCTVSAGWLAELVGGFEHEATGAVAGEIVAHPPESPVERYVSSRRPALTSWALSHPWRWIPFGSAAVRRSAFERIGLFDTELRGCEDIDLSWRLLLAGFEIDWRPRALVFHRHPATIRALVRQRVRYGRGHASLIAKYPEMIRWNWQRERVAWGDVARTARDAARLGVRALSKKSQAPGDDFAWTAIDLTRKLADRAGFVQGMLRTRLGSSVRPVSEDDSLGSS
jgi:glycosyltransferase involved in cell wall biosynthesis